MIEDKDETRKGVPGISRGSIGWAFLLTSLTGPLYPFWMGIYMSAWIRNKRETGVAVYGYVLLPLFLLLGFLPSSFWPPFVHWDSIETGLTLLWIANAFVLRRELMLYYATPEGGELEMSPWLTGLFNVYYLNYCLWVVRDSA